MTHTFHSAVLAQPDHLRGGAAAVRDALASLDLAPWREGTLVVSGIGASWHAAAPFVRALRAAGRRAFGVAAPALADAAAAGARLGDAYVLISQSGRSSETVAALDALDDAPVLAVSAAADSPLAARAAATLPLGPERDTPLSTLGYTGTLQTLGMLAEALATGEAGAPGDHWARLPELLAELLADADAPASEIADRFGDVACVDAIGPGASVSSAGETALLVREGLRLPATGEETRQYLHGPLEAVADGFGCVVFGGLRERALAAELAEHGARVVAIQPSGGGDPPPDGVLGVALPPLPELAAPILEIAPVQLAVHHLASARGLPLDGLRRSQDDTKLEV